MRAFMTRLSQGPLLADGAMGTMLYARGVSFDAVDVANVDTPGVVREVHEAYLTAGADLIETNTFGANRFKLAEHGPDHDVDTVNRAGVELATAAREATGQPAFIAGSVGPLGRHLAPLGHLRPQEAYEAFSEQIDVLVAAGVDLILLETFSSLAELREAVKAAKTVAPEVPLVAEMTFGREVLTTYGHAPREVAIALLELGADVVGANCGIGPRQTLQAGAAMKSIGDESHFVAAMPNAGWPEQQAGGRILYPATAEYFAQFARDAADAHVNLIGGCCGTTPAHVRAMRTALDSWQAGERTTDFAAPDVREERRQETKPAPTRLAKALSASEFVVTVEMEPPRGADLSSVLASAAMLKGAGATVLNVSDSPLAQMRMSPWAVAGLIQNRVGIETVLHFPIRGRNLLRVQGDLLAAHALGVRNVFVVMGDPTAIGDYPDALDSYDIVPTGLMRLITEGFNEGRDYAGNSIGEPTNFLVGCALNLNPSDVARQVNLLRKKIDHGAHFALTMPFYDVDVPRRFLDAYGGPVEIPILAGVLPLYNERHASFLHNEVPGIEIPDEVMARMDAAEDKPAEGVRLAQELVTELRASVADAIQGIYIMPPFRKYEIAADVMRVVRPAAGVRNQVTANGSS